MHNDSDRIADDLLNGAVQVYGDDILEPLVARLFRKMGQKDFESAVHRHKVKQGLRRQYAAIQEILANS